MGSLSSSLLALGRDVEAAHRALLRAAEAAGLDHGEAADRLQAFLVPAEPSEVEAARHRLESVEALRPTIDGAATPPTRALWLDSVLLARLQLHALGAAVDLDAVVALAEFGTSCDFVALTEFASLLAPRQGLSGRASSLRRVWVCVRPSGPCRSAA